MVNTGFIKGIALGIIAGTVIGCAVMPKTRGCKRATGKFLKTAGEIIESISGGWG